jgi:hypothetical protein
VLARVIAAIALAATVPAVAEILGKKPEYLDAAATSFPNDQAVTPRIWAPGLDDGYTPQGLTLVDKYVVVSAYQDSDANRAGCRVFRLERATGATAGFFDMPIGKCHHADGVASIGNGQIVFADSYQLWRIDLDAAMKTGHVEDGMRGTVKLGGETKGSLIFFDGTDVWTGVYTVTKDAEKAKLHRWSLRIFDERDGQIVDETNALQTLRIPPLCQGGAVAPDGSIWLTASTSKIGRLHRLDRKTGDVLATFETVNGVEGADFDKSGHMWAISEAGARKYMHWPRFFPVIFEIDTAKLR